MESSTHLSKRGFSMSLLFDTLQYTKKAVSAGYTQAEAEFQAEGMADLIDQKLVTKEYFKYELALLEKNLSHSIDQKLNKMTWALLGGIPTVMTIMAGVFGVLLKMWGKV